MMNRLFMRAKAHGSLCFCLSIAIIVFALHMFSVYERNLWQYTSGKITYVKEVSDHNYMYTIEYMTQIDAANNKVRLFKNASSSPFRGQEVRLRYKKNNIQEFVILGPLKYMPEPF